MLKCSLLRNKVKLHLQFARSIRHTHTPIDTKDPSVDLDRIIPFRFYGDGCEAMRNLANMCICGNMVRMESLFEKKLDDLQKHLKPKVGHH